MRHPIDFDGIKAVALRSARQLLQELLPGGKFQGDEYVVRNPLRNDRHPGSFKINYRTGVWKDFATGDGGGDLISLVAFVRGSTQGDAGASAGAGITKLASRFFAFAVAGAPDSFGTGMPNFAANSPAASTWLIPLR